MGGRTGCGVVGQRQLVQDLRADRQDLALGPGGSSGQQLGKVGQSETGGTTAGGGATVCLVRSQTEI